MTGERAWIISVSVLPEQLREWYGGEKEYWFEEHCWPGHSPKEKALTAWLLAQGVPHGERVIWEGWGQKEET